MEDPQAPPNNPPPPPPEAPAAPAPQSPAPAPAPAGGGRLLRRVGVFALFALFLASLAAGILLVKLGAQGKAEEDGLVFAKPGQPEIGWIDIHGVITDSSDGSPWSVSPMQEWTRTLKEFGKDDQVKAIILSINSPGGSVGAVQELYRQIQAVRTEDKKPVIALMGDIAASGGYYISSACDKIVAHPGTLTGSIGVIFETANVTDLLKKIGVSAVTIKSGKFKDIGSPTRPMTPEERALLQGIIDDSYGQFLQAVSDGRKIPLDQLKPIADGRVFTGAQAQADGLVDVLGYSGDAVDLAKKLGHISGTPKIVRYEEDVFERLGLTLDQTFMPADARLQRLLDPWGRAPGLEYLWQGD